MRRALIAVVLAAALPAAADSVRHRFESSVARGSVRRVVIDVPAGDVDIRNGDGNTISVSGYVSRDPDSDRNRGKEQRIVDDTSVEIVARDNEAVVRRRFGPQAQGWRAGMFSNYHIVVDVPRGIDIEVQTKYGDLTIDGSFGDIDVDMRAGDVSVRLPKKDIRQLNASARVGDVHARLGDETIEHEGFPGNTRYANPAGKTIVNVHVTAGDLNVTLTQ
ncbi:MAG TPA: DUF4097 family beta strand repeat-containing protein [Thermoanaerobaculia bacterium]